MQITPVKNNYIKTNYQINKKADIQRSASFDNKDLIKNNYYLPLNFTARTEYNILAKDYAIRASSHFRRGEMFGSACDEYRDVEDTLKLMYQNKPKNKVLIVGVGKAQEPYSIAASIYSINWMENLKDVLELNCVDLGPKLTDEEVEDASKLKKWYNDKYYAVDSMVPIGNNEYKFQDEICDLIKETFDSEEKTKWDTSIQEFVETCPDDSYDCVSINNTLGYIVSNEQTNKVISRLEKIIRPKGFLITDAHKSGYFKRFNLLSSFEEIYPGIYRKRDN